MAYGVDGRGRETGLPTGHPLPDFCIHSGGTGSSTGRPRRDLCPVKCSLHVTAWPPVSDALGLRIPVSRGTLARTAAWWGVRGPEGHSLRAVQQGWRGRLPRGHPSPQCSGDSTLELGGVFPSLAMGWRCSPAVGLGGSALPGSRPSAKGGSAQGGQHRLSHLECTLPRAAHRRGNSSRSWTGDPLEVFADVEFGNLEKGETRTSWHGSLRRTMGNTWSDSWTASSPHLLPSLQTQGRHTPTLDSGVQPEYPVVTLTTFWDGICLIVELLTRV